MNRHRLSTDPAPFSASETYLGYINVVTAQSLPLCLHSLLKQAQGLLMPASIRQVLAKVLQGLSISHVLSTKLSFCDVQAFTIVRLCPGKRRPSSPPAHFCQTIGNDSLMGVRLAKTGDCLFSGPLPPPFCIFIAFLKPQLSTLTSWILRSCWSNRLVGDTQG
jgi:hypothetical protein